MKIRVNSPHVISETIDGETIVIHLGTGMYYSFRDHYGLWDTIAGTTTADDLVVTVQRSAGVNAGTVRPSVMSFLRDLLEEGLLATEEPTDFPAEEAEADAGVDGGVSFDPPRLSRYTDMQDLVLLDPVHEVGDAGWPRRLSEESS